MQSQKYAARKITNELGLSRSTTVRAYVQLESLRVRAHHKTSNIYLFTDVIFPAVNIDNCYEVHKSVFHEYVPDVNFPIGQLKIIIHQGNTLKRYFNSAC